MAPIKYSFTVDEKIEQCGECPFYCPYEDEDNDGGFCGHPQAPLDEDGLKLDVQPYKYGSIIGLKPDNCPLVEEEDQNV